MSRRELIVSGPSGDPRVAEQVMAVRADPSGAEERELVVSERDAPAFQVELLGTDGSVRGRWEDVVGVAELWARIDAMPIRRRELRLKAADQPTPPAPV
jgi:hypothetical protein